VAPFFFLFFFFSDFTTVGSTLSVAPFFFLPFFFFDFTTVGSAIAVALQVFPVTRGIDIVAGPVVAGGSMD